MKKKLDTFLTAILVTILAILIFCYGQLKILNKEYINFCGYTIFQVITGSMKDTIKPQDIVIVKLTDDVKVNDIITFKVGGNFVTHRIIGIEENKYITKGDANNSQDEPITNEVIVGKVVFVINNVSTWMNVIKEPIVIFSIIGSIIVIKLMFLKKTDEDKK